MREILFRGQIVDAKGWVYGYLYKEGSQSFILKGGRHYPDVVCGQAPLGILDWCEVIPETVGQFTGLYAGVFNSLCGDKEYDEIYEGDKISVTYANQGMSNSHEHTITGVVAFKDGSFVVEWDFPKKGKYKHQTLNSVKRLGDCGVVIKIIGNIHDNPEMMKRYEEV